MINKINETFKDIYDAVDVMEATIKEQRAEIKRLHHMEEVDQLLIKELLGITEELRKESYEAKDIALKSEDRYFVALVERDEARRMYCSMVENNARQYGTSAQSVAKQAGWDCFKETA